MALHRRKAILYFSLPAMLLAHQASDNEGIHCMMSLVAKERGGQWCSGKYLFGRTPSFPFLPFPSLPLEVGPLLRLGGLGSAQAPPAGPGGARRPAF